MPSTSESEKPLHSDVDCIRSRTDVVSSHWVMKTSILTRAEQTVRQDNGDIDMELTALRER